MTNPTTEKKISNDETKNSNQNEDSVPLNECDDHEIEITEEVKEEDEEVKEEEVKEEEVKEEEEEEVKEEEVKEEEEEDEDTFVQPLPDKTITDVPVVDETNSETFVFQAEINQLMSLIINTFYSNKDIFLRELISNSSDALDKIRHESLVEPSKLSAEESLHINLITSEDKNIFIIEDTGIGMTKTDLINNLGTIAKSGTKSFMEAVQNNANLSMIGQFGVGFYSAFLVADKVQVISKHNDDEEFMWESDAGGCFRITSSNIGLKRGTRMILHLKDDQENLRKVDNIRQLVKTHSQYVNYPISILVQKTKEVEVEEEDIEEEDVGEEKEKDENKEKKDEDGVVEEEDEDEEKKEEKKKKTVTETYEEWDKINVKKPLWLEDPKEISTKKYNDFYKHISGDYNDYGAVKHFTVEGQLDFTCLLFIPKQVPFDMFEPNKKRNNIKLYVRRIFISDDCQDLCPEWLSFVKGIVDSQDLPLNISRETLQQNQIMKIMKKNIVKKILDKFNELTHDEDTYMEFYNQYHKNLKLGIHDDSTYRDKLVKLLRYYSTKSDEKMTSLDDYVSRMKENQEHIYFISGESKKSVENSLFLEKMKKHNLEVLFMCDPIDEYCLQQLNEFEGKKFKNITKENLDLPLTKEEEEEEEEKQKEFKDLCDKMKNILSNNISSVIVSNRLNDSPCCIVTGEHAWSANMERIMKAQTLKNDSMMGYMTSNKIMEINIDNPVIIELKNKLSVDKNDKTINDIVWLLHDTTLLNSGFHLEEPSSFCNRINRMIKLGLSLDDDNEIENTIEEALEETDAIEAEADKDESKMEEVD